MTVVRMGLLDVTGVLQGVPALRPAGFPLSHATYTPPRALGRAVASFGGCAKAEWE